MMVVRRIGRIAHGRTARFLVWTSKMKFWVYVYGLGVEDLATVPNHYIQEIIRKRGWEHLSSSIFTLEDVR